MVIDFVITLLHFFLLLFFRFPIHFQLLSCTLFSLNVFFWFVFRFCVGLNFEMPLARYIHSTHTLRHSNKNQRKNTFSYLRRVGIKSLFSWYFIVLSHCYHISCAHWTLTVTLAPTHRNSENSNLNRIRNIFFWLCALSVYPGVLFVALQVQSSIKQICIFWYNCIVVTWCFTSGIW